LLPQLRALFASMRRHCRPFTLHVLTEGREVFDWALEQGAELAATAVEGFVRRHPELAREALPGPLRNLREVAITRRWTFAAELLGCCAPSLTVIDADLWFFSSPEPVFAEIDQRAAMAVLPHGFAPASLGAPGATMETHRKYGLYNAGWVYFADYAAAAHFADLCREGPISYDRVHADGVTRWGEQGSLEVVAEAHRAHVIQHPGAAPGPWCANAQPLETGPPVMFGGRTLVAWHYHSLRFDGERLARPEYAVGPHLATVVYRPYLAALATA
jgi:hypothetical protein